MSAFMSACIGQEEGSLTTEDIVSNSVEASGGIDHLNAVQTRIYQGETTITAGEFHQTESFTLYEKRPGKSYYETPIGDRKLIFATNGQMGWTQNDGALAPYAMPNSEARGVLRRSVFDRFLIGMAKRGVLVSYLGTRAITAIDDVLPPEVLHELVYVYPDGDSVLSYFDPDTHLLRMTERKMETSIGPTLVQVYHSAYRNVEGIQISHEWTTLFPGEKHVSKIRSVRIGDDIPDDQFEMPAPPGLTSTQRLAVTGVYAFTDRDVTIELIADTLYYRAEEDNFVMIPVADTLFLAGTGYAMQNLIFDTVQGGPARSLTLQKGDEKETGLRKL